LLEDIGATEDLPADYTGHGDDGQIASVLQSNPSVVQARMKASTLALLERNEGLFSPVGPSGKAQIVRAKAEQWLKTAHELNDAILLAMWLGGGMPSRASEFTTILYSSDKSVDRQLFVEPSANGPLLRTCISYNKVCFLAYGNQWPHLTLYGLRQTMHSIGKRRS